MDMTWPAVLAGCSMKDATGLLVYLAAMATELWVSCSFPASEPALLLAPGGFTDHALYVQRYQRLMEQNEKHGSFYLQSKVFRARERIEQEARGQHSEGEQQQGPS